MCLFVWSLIITWKIKFFADLNADSDSLAPAEDANEEEKNNLT